MAGPDRPTPRLLVVGYLSIDTVQTADGRRHRTAGGAGLYQALAARRAGGIVDLCASVGADFPEAWLAALANEGIGIGLVARRDGPSRWAHIRHAPDGRRISTHYADPAWWDAGRRHVPRPPRDLSEFRAVVAGPLAPDDLEPVIAAAEAAGIATIADTSEAHAAGGGAALLDLVRRLTVFAPSREETRLLFPDASDDEAARRLARLGPTVVQKCGSDGLFLVEAGGTRDRRKAAAPADPVDPTGAGDAAVGALAAVLAAGGDLDAAADAAITAGARAVGGQGPSGLCAALRPVDLCNPEQGDPVR
jgi:sugar/nucleoside kinase (ribokinase family)